jgi:enoyl-[acyl-carrier protein] reductase III
MSILITGGTKGIGLAVARRFAKPGCKIFLNYLRDDRTAEAAVAALRAAGAAAFAFQADVSTPAGTGALIDRVARETAELRLIVHCESASLSGLF